MAWNKNLFFHSSGGQKSKINVSAQPLSRASPVALGESSPAASSFWGLWTFLGLWLHNSSLLSSSQSLPFFVSPFLMKIFVIGFRAHLDNPEWSYLEILNYICKVFFQIRSHPPVLEVRMWTYLFGVTIQLTIMVYSYSGYCFLFTLSVYLLLFDIL